MLDRILQHERRLATSTVLRYYAERYHRHTVLVPSGRFGLYAAARELLAPGDHVVVSPITCRSVIQALLAAGVTPVFADIELESGNIDVRKLRGSLLTRARAIVTTNLYGNPDRAPELASLARAHGLLLIEDCAHVLRTSVDGRLIGSFGDVSVFSFKKYFDEPGGVVTLRSEEAARRIEARVRHEAIPADSGEERLRYAQQLLMQMTSPASVASLSAMYRRLRSTRTPSGGDESGVPRQDQEQGGQLRRRLPSTAVLMRVAELLNHSEQFISRRMAAVSELIANCPLTLKKSRYAGEVCFLVVPYFSPQRDAIVDAVRRVGIPTYFLYRPATQWCETAPERPLDREAIETWCRHILPIDPRFSRRYLDAIQELPEVEICAR